MSEKKPICGILAGEPEIIGERCADGGKCHHRCTDTCSRRSTCAPLSGSGLRFDWSPVEPSLSGLRDAAGDRFEVPVAWLSGPAEPATAQDEREALPCPFCGGECDATGWLRGDGVRGPECESCGATAASVEVWNTRPAQTEQQPVAWGAFHFRSGKLYTHCETEEQIERYIADLHRSNDSITLRKGPLYAARTAHTAPQPSCLHPEIAALLEEAADWIETECTSWNQEFAARIRAVAARHSSGAALSLADVVAERRRQIAAEGWTPEHDDEHSNGEMALAAACYARHAIVPPALSDVPATWPWGASWWKPGDPRRMLVKAGALILAEIERLDRAGTAGSLADGCRGIAGLDHRFTPGPFSGARYCSKCGVAEDPDAARAAMRTYLGLDSEDV